MSTQKSDLITRSGLWQRLVAPQAGLTDPQARHQAQLLAALLLFLAPFCALGMLYTLLFSPNQTAALMLGASSIALSALYFVSRSRRYYLAAWVTIGVLFSAPFSMAISQGNTKDIADPFVWSALPILLSSIFLSLRALLAVALVNISGLLAIPALMSQVDLADVFQPLNLLIDLFIMTIILNHYRSLVERDRQAELLESNRELQMIRESLEQRVTERTQDLAQQAAQLALAKDAAERARQEAEAEREKAEALNRLNARLQGQQELSALADNVIQYLCQCLHAQVGTLFLLRSGVLEPVGGYATPQAHLSKRFKLGEGVLGQAALEKQAIVLSDVPEDQVLITSGLGQMIPEHVLVLPFLYQDQVLGVVEIGTLSELTPVQHEFLSQAMENVATAFNTAQARARIDELLLETQQQTEELQAREEELRSMNEELEAQAEHLRTQQDPPKRKRPN